MRIFVAVVVWVAAIAAAAGLSSAVAGSIHSSPTTSSSASSTSSGSTSTAGSSTSAASTTATPVDPSAVQATAADSLFHAGNLSRVLGAATSRFGSNAQVGNFALYPGYLAMTVVKGGSQFEFYMSVGGTSSTTSMGAASGGSSAFKLSDVKATAPATLAARIAGFGHVPESRLHYMVAHVDPVSGHFQWLIYPVSGSGAEYFQANGARAPLFEYTGSGLVRLAG